MDSCDVLIVGGGPAGSTLAWKLRNRGLDVMILDKSAFPRDKVCAGWITPATTDLLHIDTDEYARQRVLQPITGFRTGIIGGAVAWAVSRARMRKDGSWNHCSSASTEPKTASM